MLEKLKSRKFIMAATTFVSVFLSEAFGVEMAPEAIAGLVLITATYVFGEGMVDRKAVEASAREMQVDALATAAIVNQQLEQRLAEVYESFSPAAAPEDG